jgi:trehalose 6-phosphate synthase
VFDICPWGDEILDGLLGNDLLGFHTEQYCHNFEASAGHVPGTIVDQPGQVVRRQGHCTLVEPFPISVDFDGLTHAAQDPAVVATAERLQQELGLTGMCVAVGVDRVDYTKGIAERFLAVDRFLTKYPSYRGRFVLLQVGPLSRILIDEYSRLNDELYRLMNAINRRHGQDSWSPIHLLKANYAREAVLAFFRLADLCIVSSLHDGMNLVAKEFVSARPDGAAALLLSRFTGAAAELTNALLINPYDVDAFADGIKAGLEMPLTEKRRRMRTLRQAVARHNIYDWAADIVTEVSRLP